MIYSYIVRYDDNFGNENGLNDFSDNSKLYENLIDFLLLITINTLAEEYIVLFTFLSTSILTFCKYQLLYVHKDLS